MSVHYTATVQSLHMHGTQRIHSIVITYVLYEACIQYSDYICTVHSVYTV